MNRNDRPQSWHQQFLNWGVNVGSVVICLLLLPTRFPGMQLLGIGPNWLLIWVVVWSIKRRPYQGALAGLALGLIQDGMTHTEPTHALSLVLVGFLTSRLQKSRFLQEDFISVALIVFVMALLAQAIIAVQFGIAGDRPLEDIWTRYQVVALSSAILSSLWAPVVYFPLNHWWERQQILERL